MKASPMHFAQKPHDITLVLLVHKLLHIVLITFKEMFVLFTNAFIVGALKNDMFFIFNLLLIAKLANTTMSGYRVVRVAF